MAGLGTRLLAACSELADQITAAGVDATVDRSKVRLPGAFVHPESLDLLNLAGDGTARVHVTLVVPDSGDWSSTVALAELLNVVLDATSGAPLLIPAEPVDTSWALSLPHSTSAYPAFRVSVDLDV